MPTVRLEADFRAISRMGDIVRFGLRAERVGGRSLELALQACSGDALRVSSRQVLVFTSLDTHKPIPAPDDVRHAIETRFLNLT